MSKTFFVPVLELLVAVLVRIVNLFLRHSYRMTIVNGENQEAVCCGREVANSQKNERNQLLSSAADNSNLEGCPDWSRQQHVDVTSNRLCLRG